MAHQSWCANGSSTQDGVRYEPAMCLSVDLLAGCSSTSVGECRHRLAASPFAYNIWPRLLAEVSVSGCRSPRVSRCSLSASRSSRSAAVKSPLACSSWPRVLVERVRVTFAERLALHLHGCAEQRLGGSEVACFLQQRAEVVDSGERVRVPIAEGLAHHHQCLTQQRLSGIEVALGPRCA